MTGGQLIIGFDREKGARGAVLVQLVAGVKGVHANGICLGRRGRAIGLLDVAVSKSSCR